MNYFTLILSVFLAKFCTAQSDSVVVTELAFFKEGLYLSQTDFRHNQPISKEQITTTINKDLIDFYYKLTSNPLIQYSSANTTYTLDAANIWGFVQNNVLFVNYKGNFYRVPVFGAISYFAGVIEVTGYYTGVYDPMYGMGGTRAVKTKEVTEFIISYYNGKIVLFDMDYVDLLLKSDEEVYKEYKSLSKRKRRKQITHFIRMYNDKHPVYYLK